jgi:hypothetical protein
MQRAGLLGESSINTFPSCGMPNPLQETLARMISYCGHFPICPFCICIEVFVKIPRIAMLCFATESQEVCWISAVAIVTCTQ